MESPVQSSRGAGYVIPERKADCTGRRPSHYPFQINVCDWACDEPDPIPFTARQLRIPEAPDA